VGESGCGKTTIGRLVVGLDAPTSGTINFDGADITRLRGSAYRRARRHIQLMFQDSYASLDPRMRAGTILREPLAAQGIGTRRDQQQRIDELLDQVGLPRTSAERYPHEFSGGQRQRLGLARALTLSPKLIVADEPVSALDVSIQAQVLNLMRDLQRQFGLAYLFISHDLAVVRYLADHIGVMYLGKLVETGPTAQVYANPAHPYTRGLIDSAPVADPAAERFKAHAGITGELPSGLEPPSGCRFRTRCPLAPGPASLRHRRAEAAPLRPRPPRRLPLPPAYVVRISLRVERAASVEVTDCSGRDGQVDTRRCAFRRGPISAGCRRVAGRLCGGIAAAGGGGDLVTLIGDTEHARVGEEDTELIVGDRVAPQGPREPRMAVHSRPCDGDAESW
jgi:oligopeptide/dipeptide ABC transporter ATP-binding protein